MKIQTISFDPLVVAVDGKEIPISETTYQDEDGHFQKVSYVEVNGEKFPIKYQAVLLKHLDFVKLDTALVKVEEDRLKKIEDQKPK